MMSDNDRAADDHSSPAPNTEAEETLCEFPCDFPIKAMGPAHADLQAVLAEILARHGARLAEEPMTLRPSSGGRWVSVTARVRAESKAQLDAIYRDLTAHEMVVYAL
jgi:putative lipoic acid-binding regulatory protein